MGLPSSPETWVQRIEPAPCIMSQVCQAPAVCMQAEVDLRSFRQLAAREKPAVSTRVLLATKHLAAQRQREHVLQDRYKELQAQLADLQEGAAQQPAAAGPLLAAAPQAAPAVQAAA